MCFSSFFHMCHIELVLMFALYFFISSVISPLESFGTFASFVCSCSFTSGISFTSIFFGWAFLLGFTFTSFTSSGLTEVDKVGSSARTGGASGGSVVSMVVSSIVCYITCVSGSGCCSTTFCFLGTIYKILYKIILK